MSRSTVTRVCLCIAAVLTFALLPGAAAAAPKPKASIGNAAVNEGSDDRAKLTVKLSRKAPRRLSVAYATADGTAVAGQDYSAKQGRVGFRKGQRSKTVSINLLDDSADEPAEAFTVKLSNPKNAALGDRSGRVTIADDDPSGGGGIAAVRAAGDDPVSIPLTGVTVTYVKPAVGSELPGFFIQEDGDGPAIYVNLNPAIFGLTAGDIVNMRVTSVATDNGARIVTGIDDVAKTGATTPANLTQNTNAVGLVAGLGLLEHELIDLSGTVAENFSNVNPACVTGCYVQAAILPGSDPASPFVKLRMPATVRNALDVTAGCTFQLNDTPLWRLNNVAQPTAWAGSNLEVISCPAPKVVSATAIDNTHVRVVFDRRIDFLTVNGNASQFTFNNGLTASNATLQTGDKEIILETSAQAAATSYTVTVATTVRDTRGTALNASANTATFTGAP